MIERKPGRELDEEIAKKIFNMVVLVEEFPKVVKKSGEKSPLPAFSTHIDQAFKIMSAMKNSGFDIKIGYEIRNQSKEVIWYASTVLNNEEVTVVSKYGAPHVICLLALEVFERTNKQTKKSSDSKIIDVSSVLGSESGPDS